MEEPRWRTVAASVRFHRWRECVADAGWIRIVWGAKSTVQSRDAIFTHGLINWFGIIRCEIKSTRSPATLHNFLLDSTHPWKQKSSQWNRIHSRLFESLLRHDQLDRELWQFVSFCSNLLRIFLATFLHLFSISNFFCN